MKILIIFIVLLASVFRSNSQDKTLPIIDAHLHGGYTAGKFIITPEGQPLARPCRPVPCNRIPAELASAEEVIPRTIEEMRRNNIVLGLLTDSPPYPKDEQWIFDKWEQANPNGFIYGYYLKHPFDISIAHLRALLKNGDIQMIGELAFQYNEISIDDPILEPLFDLADELDVPVYIHLGANGRQNEGGFPMYLGNPLKLEPILRKHPELRICIENASFPFLHELVALTSRYPNVYVDLSTVTWGRPRQIIHHYLNQLMDYGLGKRILFGTDQMMWPEVIPIAIETIRSADFLTFEEKRDIFYNNAARFLRLSEEQIAQHHEN